MKIVIRILITISFLLTTDITFALAPESPFHGPDIELTLKEGIVERPALIEYDNAFWERVEASNPEIFEKVKKIIATYFDDTTDPLATGEKERKPLKEGVDFDFISGRTVVIKIPHPVEIEGVLMKEILLKSAPFKKCDEGQKFYPTRDRSPETIDTLEKSGSLFEFDKDGNVSVRRVIFDRKDSIYYSKTNNEYHVGRHCFRNKDAPYRLLPVMNVRYLKDKGADNLALGVVVIASPTETRHFFVDEQNYAYKNRVGHILGILFNELEQIKSEPDSEPKKRDIYLHAQELASCFGRSLRSFHDAGYTHGNPHSGNALVDLDASDIQIVDLSDVRLKSNMTKLETLGYQMRDIHCAIGDFIKVLKNPQDREYTLFTIHVLRHFLIGYFVAYGFQFNYDPEMYIAEYAIDLENRLMTVFHPESPYEKKITSDLLMRNILARLLYRIVFQSEAERRIEQLFLSGMYGAQVEESA